MQDTYTSTRKEIEAGNFESLAYMHSMSSGLKSLCTTLAADGIETCRRALGGHGFGGGSGLIQLNNDYLSKPTVEGDNWMITQQTAAYLVKKMSTAVEGAKKGARDEIDAQFERYLPQIRGASQSGYNILERDEDLVKSFQHRATALVRLFLPPIQRTPMLTDLPGIQRLPSARREQEAVDIAHD
jgi:acyl-CoA oxidase